MPAAIGAVEELPRQDRRNALAIARPVLSGRLSAATKPIALATVLAALSFPLGDLALPARGTIPPQAAMATPPPIPALVEPEPEAEPEPEPPPPARNRSLCSAASEAAGLCDPQ